jgi:hypothetical protein
MANWCNNDIEFFGSAERIDTLIRGWKTQVGVVEPGGILFDLPLADGSGVQHQFLGQPDFGSNRLTCSTKWLPPRGWLAAITAEHRLAALLVYFDEADGSTTRELFVCGEAYPLYAVRAGCGGEIEVLAYGDPGKKHLLPDPLPSAEFEAARTGATVDEILRHRDEAAVDALRLVNESLASDCAETPLALTAANKRRVNEIFHQRGSRSPEWIHERLDQFDREPAVQAG